MSTTKRVKAPAVVPAKDRAEAERLVGEIGAASRSLDLIETALKEATAKAKADAEAEAGPLKAARTAALARVQAWANANRADLTGDGRTKTVRLATGEIAWRMTPTAVRITGEAAVIATLLKRRLVRFLRRSVALNKEAMLADREAAERVPGVAFEQREEFVVTPATAQLSPPEGGR